MIDRVPFVSWVKATTMGQEIAGYISQLVCSPTTVPCHDYVHLLAPHEYKHPTIISTYSVC